MWIPINYVFRIWAWNVIMTWTACELTFKDKEDDAWAEVLNDGQKYQEMRMSETFQCVRERDGKYVTIRRWEHCCRCAIQVDHLPFMLMSQLLFALYWQLFNNKNIQVKTWPPLTCCNILLVSITCWTKWLWFCKNVSPLGQFCSLMLRT